jgi:hypothetical protein
MLVFCLYFFAAKTISRTIQAKYKHISTYIMPYKHIHALYRQNASIIQAPFSMHEILYVKKLLYMLVFIVMRAYINMIVNNLKYRGYWENLGH